MSYSRFLDLLAMPLSWLALPVILVCLYDKFVLAPHRPRKANGDAEPGPTYTRVAGWLLPFVILAVVRRIGVSEVFALGARNRGAVVVGGHSGRPVVRVRQLDPRATPPDRGGCRRPCRIRRCCVWPMPFCRCW